MVSVIFNGGPHSGKVKEFKSQVPCWKLEIQIPGPDGKEAVFNYATNTMPHYEAHEYLVEEQQPATGMTWANYVGRVQR